MALVDYSDSDASDDEQPSSTVPKTQAPPTSSFSTAKLVDKANPGKIRVQFGDSKGNSVAAPSQDDTEPAAKRARTGGAFSGFNAQLPPPRHDADKAAAAVAKATPKAATRKVFSLKTGAEPAFSRESDAELRQLFAEQDSSSDRNSKSESASAIPNTATKPASTSVPTNAFMFKPLSVARSKNSRARPKKQSNGSITGAAVSAAPRPAEQSPAQTPQPPPAAKKISLFSSGEPVDIPEHDVDGEVNDTVPDAGPDPVPDTVLDEGSSLNHTDQQNPPAQTLSSIADDLNLSAADKRQLFGRSRGGGAKGTPGAAAATTALNITNFNTDHEYAANQELIAKGDQVMHNPVRAIAPGKHSLRQLVNAAQGQKEALEDSFAAGKRNKKEAGSKYGWS